MQKWRAIEIGRSLYQLVKLSFWVHHLLIQETTYNDWRSHGDTHSYIQTGQNHHHDNDEEDVPFGKHWIGHLLHSGAHALIRESQTSLATRWYTWWSTASSWWCRTLTTLQGKIWFLDHAFHACSRINPCSSASGWVLVCWSRTNLRVCCIQVLWVSTGQVYKPCWIN